MKNKLINALPLILVSAASLALPGCWTAPNANVQPGGEARLIQSGITVESVKDPATVQALDPAQGTITLALPSGATATYKTGPKVKHFDQVQAGQTVKATVTEELAVYLLADGKLPDGTTAEALGVNAEGATGGSQLPAADAAISQRLDRRCQTRPGHPDAANGARRQRGGAARGTDGHQNRKTLTIRICKESEPMKTIITRKLAAGGLMLVMVMVMVLTSCSSTPPYAQVHESSTVVTQNGVPGGVAVETYKSSATVTAIDPAMRSVTVVSPNGATATFKAGPEVINFDQIHVGDQIRATLTKQLVVFLRTPDEPAGDGGAAAIALAPKGTKPGVVMADTVEVTAKVEAVNLKRHEATLLFPDGTSKTVPVRPDVDLTKAKLGEEVVIRTTQSVALLVEKP